MRHNLFFIIILHLFVVFTGCSQPLVPATNARSLPMPTLCELAGKAAIWDQREVRLKAVLITDMRHGIVLKDKGCIASRLELSNRGVPEEDSFRKFYEAMVRKAVTGALQVYDVELEGQFSMSSDERVQGTINIHKIIYYAEGDVSFWSE